jgi:aryl-alcohol dehydrogenase-like predicted oxidoreductase
VEHRALGASGIDVSVLSLGSWQTYERIPREDGVAVMAAARAAGIDFLDDARYDDRTGTAPLATGYSEVVFGDLFRASGWRRDDVVVANKLWWELWPQQSAAEELDASLGRMGFDHLDLAYSAEPPEGLALAELVGIVGELIESGKLLAWGVLNWPGELVGDASRIAAEAGVPQPCAAQLPYALAYPEVVEGERLGAGLDEARASVVASYVLAGGALTGKYAAGGAGRLAGEQADPRRRRWFEVGGALRRHAAEVGSTPARLAIAFALAGPRVASVLFGATSPEQVEDNVGAIDALAALGEDGLRNLREAVGGEQP